MKKSVKNSHLFEHLSFILATVLLTFELLTEPLMAINEQTKCDNLF